MKLTINGATGLVLALVAWCAAAQPAPQVVDVPTRPGVTQRYILIRPPEPKAAVILFAGGHGGLQVDDSGGMAWGKGNFLVRTAPLFAAEGLAVAVVDAPSDRQHSPYTSPGFVRRPSTLWTSAPSSPGSNAT